MKPAKEYALSKYTAKYYKKTSYYSHYIFMISTVIALKSKMKELKKSRLSLKRWKTGITLMKGCQ